ncbi:dTMP kinase [Lentzea aerocolonigenes]|uniref:dTMP kinase n=1 Tax=Lentzea aerocolonigenes TaxID=68170 RepID=UPI0006963620|nr:hypothetical protein [Lentzea aerocolonigenes]
MKIDLAPHGQPGTLLVVCGFDGSGKTTLEEALVAAVAPVRPCVATWTPTAWWRQDANIRRTLYGEGEGQVLPEDALMHFNLADCHAHQANVILPALARGEVVIGNRYLYDMLALFEARGYTQPEWLPAAMSGLVQPDFSFVIDGSAELMVDRVVRRDGAREGRFDQDVAFVERFNTALRQIAEDNDLTLLQTDADPLSNLKQCLEVLSGNVAGMTSVATPAGLQVS